MSRPATNFLSTNYPSLFQSISTSHKYDVDISKIGSTSRQVLFWNCSCGETFSATVRQVTKRNHTLCEDCSSKILKEKLVTARAKSRKVEEKISYTHPELCAKIIKVIDFPTLNPSDLSGHSREKVEIRCDCGTVFQKTLKNFITNNSDKCGKCSKESKKLTQRIQMGNKIVNVFPHLKTQFVRVVDFPNFRFEDIAVSSSLIIEWRCKCNTLFTTQRINQNRAAKALNCTSCSFVQQGVTSKRKLDKSRKLINVDPELYKKAIRVVENKQKHISLTKTKDLAQRSQQKVEWKCDCGLLFISTPDVMRSRHTTLCSACLRNGESLFEYELKELLSQSLNTEVLLQFSKNGTPPVDNYLPLYDIAIQYDPYWSHRHKEQKDTKINSEHLKNYSKVIRFREQGLSSFKNSVSMPKGRHSLDWYARVVKEIKLPYKLLSSSEVEEALQTAGKAWSSTYMKVPNNLSTKPYFKEFVKNITHPGKSPHVTAGQSNDTCLWQCSKGHTWTAAISARNKTGCRLCGIKKRKIATKENSIAYLVPISSEEFILNIDNPMRTPNDMKFTVADRAIWKCHICNTFLRSTIMSRAKTLDTLLKGQVKQNHYHLQKSILTLDQVNKYLKEANLPAISE